MKMKIFHSVWMISHPCFRDISCINPETGKLNVERVKYFARIAANNCGATGMRILPALLIDPILYPGQKFAGYNYLPWELVNGKFDLARLNNIYFDNLAKLLEILASFNLTLAFSMYDRCHWDSPRRIPHSPWILNVNGINSMYFGGEYNEKYEDAVMSILRSKDVMIELVNEPDNENNVLIPFSQRLYQKLLKNGIKRNQVISGIRFFLDGNLNPNYPTWRKKVDFMDSHGLDAGFAVVHRFPKFSTQQHLVDAQKHTRRLFISTDGQIISHEELRKILLDYFKNRESRRNRAINWCFEGLYQGNETDRLVTRGITLAIKEYFGYFPGREPGEIDIEDPGNIGNVPEIQNKNAIIVNCGYLGILARPADPEGLKGCVDWFDKGGDMLTFVKTLTGSDEFRINQSHKSYRELAIQLHKGIMGSEPEMGELKGIMDDIRSGRIAERAAAMLESEEFKRRMKI